MSSEVMVKTVRKAVEDQRFRKLLLVDPRSALRGLELSKEEYLAITNLENDAFDYLATPGEMRATSFNLRDIGRTTFSRYNLTDFMKLAGFK